MTAAASTIHSHSSEEPDSLAAGDAETATVACGLGDGAGVWAAVVGGVCGAVVSGAVVSGAVVSGAVVSGAVVSGAVVSGAVVSGAVVSGAVVSGAVVSAGVAGSVGGSVLGERVGREIEGGDNVGREVSGGEIVGTEAPMLLLAAALDRALLRLPLPQPAARHPAARSVIAMASLAGIGFMGDPPLIASNKDQNARMNLTHQRVRIAVRVGSTMTTAVVQRPRNRNEETWVTGQQRPACGNVSRA
jgi:hypothetical protein